MLDSGARVAALLIVLAIAGCGDSSSDDDARGAPARSEFPQAGGRTLAQIAGTADQGKLVVSPVGMIFDVLPAGLAADGGGLEGLAVVKRLVIRIPLPPLYRAESQGSASRPFPAAS